MRGDGSGLRVYFRDEIENGLAGLFAAVMAAEGGGSAEYRRGFADALRAAALVFGVGSDRSGEPVSRWLSGDRRLSDV